MVRRKKFVAVIPLVFFIFANVLLAGWSLVYGVSPKTSGYHVIKTVPVGGVGQWDYCVVDSEARRLYIAHSTEVTVLDADTGAKVGSIADTPGVHGIALAHNLGRGFTSNGRANSITIFDLTTLKTIQTVKIPGQEPDAIFYDAASNRVFAFNGGSKDATAINAADGSFVGTIALGGRPEFAAGAGDGHIFANIEDRSELVELDGQKLAVLHRWPVAPCKEPSGLAMDSANRRLFAVCGNGMMAVVNANTGKVIATPRIDDDPDAAGFDPETKLVFSSNGGSGNLTVIHEDSPETYTVLDNVPTKKYARTMAIDQKTHTVFLPVADFLPVPPKSEARPKAKADTFGVLVVAK
jgi:DNA-binding beta-propeller fold protein YncE